MTLTVALTLLGTGVLAGISNAIAGGGTFFTFPAFLAAGIPPVIANASNAVAVWPGHALAVVGYRRELSRFRGSLAGSIATALTGGITGALLLAKVGNATFAKLIPFLLLFATLIFAFGGRIGASLRSQTAPDRTMHSNLFTRLVELLFAIYGGFFAAGLGVMLMAGLMMVGVTDIQANNALKNLLGTVISSVAVVVFIVSGLVSWPHALIAFAGAVVGGLLGTRLARRLAAHWLRGIVLVLGLVLSAYYFVQYY